MRPIVIDANVFKIYYEELVAENEGIGFGFMTAALAWGHVAFDENGHVQNEWRSASCGDQDELFLNWVTTKILENKIRLYSDRCHHHVKKTIDNLGVPARDRKYIVLAISAESEVLISNDIDMYEPRAKKWTAPKRHKIIAESSGCVCRYLRKDHQICVMPMGQAVAFFQG